MQNSFAGFQKCVSAVAWWLGLGVLESSLFFREIALMPCAWFYKVAKHCRLLANVLALANAFVCYVTQSLCLSVLLLSGYLCSSNVLIFHFKSNSAFKYQKILLSFLEVMLIMVHSCFLGNLVSIEKFLNFWEIMFAWHCHKMTQYVKEQVWKRKWIKLLLKYKWTFCGPLLERLL